MFEQIMGNIAGHSALIPALVALFRRRKMLPEYQPFFWCILLACSNELLITALIWFRVGNININSNLFVLGEAMLYTWQFKRWKLFRKAQQLFPAILVFLLAVWILDTLVFGKITRISSWYRIIYSLILVLLSVSYLNQIFSSTYDDLLRHPGFLITAGCIFYFTYKILVELFWLYGLNNSNTFRTQVYVILNFIDIANNLLFSYALLWTDRKQPYTMLY